MRTACLFAVPFLLATLPVLAAPPGAASSASPVDSDVGRACTAPVFRQFDFWLGRWRVTNPAGVVVGHSRITRLSQGCAVHEHWMGQKSTGNSLNYYDANDQQWHQDWVGGGGQVLHLHGHREGAAMVLQGSRTDRQGAIRDRITWTPLADGRVRQHWQFSRDDGASWKTLFLGTYTREKTSDTP